MAHSPYTIRAVKFVQRNPGCCKYDLAAALRRDGRTNPRKLYRLVNTQLRLGNIVARDGERKGTYALYVPGCPELLALDDALEATLEAARKELEVASLVALDHCEEYGARPEWA